MIISLDGWMLPAVYDHFLLLFISDIWYSQSSGHGETVAVMMCASAATDGQKCDILFQQTGDVYSNIGWIPSSSERVDTANVYLSYELYSLLWRYLRASDQQFPGRHGERVWLIVEEERWGSISERCFLQRGGDGGGGGGRAESAGSGRPPSIC